MAQASKRRYVFHFDLNNTILMKDDAKGLNSTDNVSQLDHNKQSILTSFILCRSTELSARVPGVR